MFATNLKSYRLMYWVTVGGTGKYRQAAPRPAREDSRWVLVIIESCNTMLIYVGLPPVLLPLPPSCRSASS
jgi:hypothetical protein